jgi:hypothetical protein
MKKDLVIQIKYGGLGDHLFYSHIPRIAKQTGAYNRVFISNASDFRNKDYKKLIWEPNPFVDGFTDEPETAPMSFNNPTLEESDKKTKNLLDYTMLAYGLDDGKRMHEPEIYYKPKFLPELKDKVIYDPNYISNAGFVTSKKVSKYFNTKKIHIDSQMCLIGTHAIPIPEFTEFISCATFWDFIDVVYSAKEVYCLVTGTATLAPALGRKAHVFYTKDQESVFRHSLLNNYIEL